MSSSTRTDLGSNRFARVTRISSELPEIGSGSNTGADFSEFHIELGHKGSEATTVEGITDTGRSQATSDTRESVSESPSKLYREAVSRNPGHISGPIALSEPSTTETPGSASGELRQLNGNITLGDREHWQLEWESNPSVSSMQSWRSKQTRPTRVGERTAMESSPEGTGQ